MKRKKLRKYVLPIVYVMVLGMMVTGIVFLSRNLLDQAVANDENYNYSSSVFEETDEDSELVNDEVPEPTITIARPYTSENITVAKEFYNTEESAENQEKALIFYENTYMPNTGILYEGDEAFDVVSILDGTVKEVKEDEILGKVVTIEHDKNITSVYYTLGEVKVEQGATVTQNQVIATSGTSKLQTTKPQTLLFETYVNGVLTNPNSLFDKNIAELE